MSRSELEFAVIRGRVEVVGRLAMAGEGPNARNVCRWTALHLAAQRGKVAVAETLLMCGANPGVTDNKGHTPLHLAAKHGNVAVAKMLLICGANPGVTDNKGHTPLHLAAERGHVAAAEKLLAFRAKPWVTDNSGHTPLHLAVERGHVAVAETLVAAGANPEAAERTPLLLAIGARNCRMVKALLLMEPPVSEKAVVCAITARCVHGLRLLLRQPQLADLGRSDALLVAAREGCVDAVAPLLAAGVPVAPGALHMAATGDIVRELVGAGAAVDGRWGDGEPAEGTALHYAARAGNVDVLKALLELGADLKATNSDGDTALSLAAHGRKTAAVDALLIAGADWRGAGKFAHSRALARPFARCQRTWWAHSVVKGDTKNVDVPCDVVKEVAAFI